MTDSNKGGSSSVPPPTADSPSRGGSPSAPRPVMGVPGQSAFEPFTRSPPPPPPPPPPGFITGGGGSGLHGARAVAVGGSGSGEAARIGGSPAAARKRVREGGPPVEGVESHACSVCGKTFSTHKALFGHMRSHPERGWRGAHPPPVFRAEEEFGDLPIDRPEGEGDVGVAAEEEDGKNYIVPDLNNPPPADDST